MSAPLLHPDLRAAEERPHIGGACPDPYRWLERDAPATRRWERQQDEKFARTWAAYRAPSGMDELVTRLHDIGRCSVPSVCCMPDGRQRFLFARRDPGAPSRCLTVRDDVEGRVVDRVVFDPSLWDPSGRTVLTAWSMSPQGHHVAVFCAEGGSDLSDLLVLELGTEEDDLRRTHVARDLRYTSVAWRTEGDRTTSVVYVAPSADDELVTVHERPLVAGYVAATRPALPSSTGMRVENSLDGASIVLTAVSPAGGRDVYVSRNTPALEFEPLVVRTGAFHRVRVLGDLVVSHTTLAAPHGRVCVGRLGEDPGAWRTSLPEDDTRRWQDVTLTVTDRGPVVVAVVRDGTHSEIVTVPVDGRSEPSTVPDLPTSGTFTDLTAGPDGVAWVEHTDHVTPPEIWRVDLSARIATRWYAPDEAPTFGDIASVTLEAVSEDGTVVPTTVLVARQLLDDRTGRPLHPLPTVLRVYGGFGVSMTPRFTASALAWVAAGGAWAVPALRGGGEFGAAWHAAARGVTKQRTFDDGLAVARHLVAQGWSTPRTLALLGESNGGLTAGALLVQAPAMFTAAVLIAPLFDMLRYEQAALASHWRAEYGSLTVPEQAAAIAAWSPLANIRQGVRYPAVLVASFDGDDRVPAFHARKAVAALEDAGADLESSPPVLLRRERGTGHAGRSAPRMADLVRDELAFLATHTGLLAEGTRPVSSSRGEQQ